MYRFRRLQIRVYFIKYPAQTFPARINAHISRCDLFIYDRKHHLRLNASINVW